MNEEGFEEWDADFLDQLIQVEELALSASTSSAAYQPLNPSQPLIQVEQHEPLRPVAASSHYDPVISYSPPRELSQRTSRYDSFPPSSNAIGKCAFSPTSLRRSGNGKKLEIERLKRELGHASKRLRDLDQECLELRKERDKNEEQLPCVFSKNEVEDIDVRSSKTSSFGREFGVGLNHGVPHKIQNAMPSNDRACSRADRVMPSCKTIGVQTEEAGDPAQVTLDDDPPACHALSEKLLAIWGSPSDQNLGRNLISKLLVTCQADLHVLFGFMSRNVSRSTRDPVADGSSTDVALKLHMHSFHTSEAARVSHLYSVLTKISDGVVPLESLFEPLLDLCSLENVVIVHRSLRILHGFLKCLLSLERKFEKRDNVIVEELCSGNNAVDGHGSDSSLLGVIINETSYAGCTPLGIIVPDAESPCNRETWSHDIAISVSCVDWVSLVEFMHQIVMKNAEECVRLEAVSVMNVILIESEAYIDREKFGQKMFFESLSQLLRKEAGLRVQKHAVYLLHLLFNSFGSLFNEGPKLLAMFCSGCNEGTDGALDDNARPQKFINVLHGLADCVTCRGNGLQELTLCRNAVIVLAFLASSGKPGFEILVSPKLYREANFLMLILQVLVSEMDIEAAAFAEPPEIFKERTLLFREVLILLNRLVSNPAYSVSALRALTNSRDMASLTIYIANRLSRKDQRLGQPDSMIRQMRESEIVNLAQVFKKRVFTYLGDSIT